MDTVITSGANGSYSLSGLPNGVYTIKPTKTGYYFSPDSLIVTVSGADISIPNIIATFLAPEISIDSTTLTFGSVYVDSSASRSFTISNRGNAGLVVSGISSNNSVFTLNTASDTIAAGDSLLVTVTFKPTATDSQSARIRIISNDSDEDTLTVNVSGKGILSTYTLQGRVKDDTTGLSGVSVHVTGAGVDTTLTTGSGGSYSLFGLRNGTFILIPSRSGYSFSPDSLTVTVSGANASLPDIIAKQDVPDIVVDTTALVFDSVYVNVPDTLVLSIRNNGKKILTVSSIASSNSDVFKVNTLSAAIAPGGSIRAEVIVSSSVIGLDSTAITITSDDPESPKIIVKAYATLYGPPLLITSIDPSSVYQGSQNDTLVITGENFKPGAIASFGGAGLVVLKTEYTDSNHLAIILNVATDAPAGPRDVRVLNPDGVTGIGPDMLTVKEGMKVFEISPYYLQAGSDSLYLTISGSGFAEGVTISFSGTGISLRELKLNGTSQMLALISVAVDALPGQRDITFTLADFSLVRHNVVEIVKNKPPEIVLTGQWRVREGEHLTFVVHARDPEGGPITLSATNLPAGASFQGRAFTWRPGYDQAGVYKVLFTVTDRLGASATAEVNIVVENCNRPPRLMALTNHQSNVGEPMVFEIAACDPDGDVLAITASGLPVGATLVRFSDSSFVFNWVPAETDIGTYHIDITATDPFGGTDRRNMALTARSLGRAVNLAPTFGQTPPLVVKEGEYMEVILQATDPEGDPVVIISGALPPSADFDPVTRRFTFRPDYKQSGEYDLLFIATDGKLSSSQKFTVKVEEQNAAPVILPVASKAVSEGATLNFVVAAVDSGGDALTYEATGLPRGAYLDANTGNFIFRPDYTQAGSYAVTFRVRDQGGQTAQTTAAITVADVNQPPRLSFIPDQFVKAGESLSFSVTAIDPDGDALTFSFVSSSLADTMFKANTRIFSYKAGSQAGTFAALFVVADGSGAADSQEVKITVTEGANRPPAIDEVAERHYIEGDSVRITLAASDPEGSNLSFSVVNANVLPAAMRQIGSGGVYQFVVDYNSAGRYAVVFGVSDGVLTSTVSAVINIDNRNLPPVLSPIADQTVAEGAKLEIAFSATDPDGDALNYDISYLPRGAALDRSSGRFVFEPDFDQADTLYLALSVSDGLATATGNFKLVVVNTNRAPVIRRVRDPQVEEGGLLEFEMEADDPDGDSAWVVVDSSKISDLGKVTPGAARIRNGRSFLFDTAKLVAGVRIPSAVLTFYAIDEHGARSAEEIVDIAVIRKMFEHVKDLPPGLEKKLDWNNLGIQIAIRNNSSDPVSTDVDAHEVSGKVKKGNGQETLLSGVLDSQGADKQTDAKQRYRNTYLSASGEEREFYGIRRGWGLRFSSVPLNTQATASFTYVESDLPLEIGGFTEAGLALYGLDSVSGQFTKIQNAVINPDSNTASFSVASNRTISEYTLGLELGVSEGTARLDVECIIDGRVLSLPTTYNATGPYVINVSAPAGALVTNASLFYRTDSLSAYKVTALQKAKGSQNLYVGEIPGLNGRGVIQYYAQMTINFETLSAPLNPATKPYELMVVPGISGDVSGDGAVNIFDLLELLKVLSGRVEKSASSDIDQNGVTNVFDLLALLRVLSNR